MSDAPKKKWLITMTLAFMILVAASVAIYLAVFYQNGIDMKTYHVTPREVTEKIISDLKITNVTEIKQDQLIKHYDMPDGIITDFSIYMSTSANKSFEIACFELQDKNQLEELKTVIAGHVATKAQGFKNLSPAEYDQLQSYKVVCKEQIVLLIISDNVETIEKDFYSIFM